MSEDRGGQAPGVSESDLGHPFFRVLELSYDDATAREIRFRQFADHLTQREKQNVKQQIEAARYHQLSSTREFCI